MKYEDRRERRHSVASKIYGLVDDNETSSVNIIKSAKNMLVQWAKQRNITIEDFQVKECKSERETLVGITGKECIEMMNVEQFKPKTPHEVLTHSPRGYKIRRFKDGKWIPNGKVTDWMDLPASINFGKKDKEEFEIRWGKVVDK